MDNRILNIYCPNCTGPASFDIVSQVYRCGYCGSEIKVEEIALTKREEQEAANRKIQQSSEAFELEKAICTGCGATLVFEEKEALANCAFCGRSLVREKYVAAEDIPQSVIPFALTQEEAMERLQEWCNNNSGKVEAKKLKKHLEELKGYYLPYRLIQGPCISKITAKSGGLTVEAKGYLKNTFVDCSNQIDNYILDAIEPYDLSDLKEFDFAYVAGHRVKISDLTEEKAVGRAAAETHKNYREKIEKIWKTKAVTIVPKVEAAVNVPVLLPVYYINNGEIQAAVNGQTGKVSVRAINESTYIDLPWWIKGLTVLLAALASTYGASRLLSQAADSEFFSLYITGVLGIFYLIVFACMFEPTDKYHKTIVKYRNIYNSGDNVFKRVRGELVRREETLKRELEGPVFTEVLNGKTVEIMYRFRSLPQILKMVAITVIVIFLPIICALIINGFQFTQIDIAGSAVWLCIAVPVAPIYLIVFGIKGIYNMPWIYVYNEEGKLKKYRSSLKEKISNVIDFLQFIIRPPFCIIAAIIIAVFCIMVYLTAFGM